MLNVQNKNYPIEIAKEQIVGSVRENPVTIITADTGAGKTTQVAQYLFEAGYEVINTLPNRIAVTSVAARVADEMGVPLGDLVGYQTGFERNFSKETCILYSTETLELIKQLSDVNGDPTKVIILDEIQDWGISPEALAAFLKYKISRGFQTKIVLMSATLDEKISAYFNDAPIIKVPGRIFPIEELTYAPTHEEYNPEDPTVTMIRVIVRAIVDMYNRGQEENEARKILVILPGKHEIATTIHELRKLHLNADIFPLHADLPIEEQQRVFEVTSRAKIVVSTNVAETSITIPDIDTVIDSGLERRMVNLEGMETLMIVNISKSSMIQRKGRAGRTKPGIYIWCGEVPKDELEEYPIPDILVGDITKVVLQLASANIKVEDLEFFHQPPHSRFLEAQKTLRYLGAFDENNQITEIGKVMTLLPISVRYARMIVEAAKRDVLEDVLTIAAIQECGGIKLQNTPYSRLTQERTNDLLADLDAFNALKKKLNEHSWSIVSCDTNPFEGFNKRSYFRIMELRAKISDVLYRLYDDITSSGNRRDITLCCAAGLVEHLYIKENSNNWYRGSSGDSCRRKIDQYSNCLPMNMILGIPKNLSLHRRAAISETQILYLINGAIAVNEDMLKEVAPHLFHTEEVRICNPAENEYTIVETSCFGDTILDSKEYQITDVEVRRDLAASWLAHNTFEPDDQNDPRLNEVLEKNRSMFRSFNDARAFYGSLLFEKAKNSVPSLAKPKNYRMLLMHD